MEGKVRLLEQAGDDLSGIPRQYFDLVVINEVVQYFPSIQYLLRVLEQLPELVAPESRIFLGDLRNLELLEAFRASVEVSRGAGSSLAQLRQRIHKQMRREKELLIAPSFFDKLKKEWPWIEEIEIELKGGALPMSWSSIAMTPSCMWGGRGKRWAADGVWIGGVMD